MPGMAFKTRIEFVINAANLKTEQGIDRAFIGAVINDARRSVAVAVRESFGDKLLRSMFLPTVAGNSGVSLEQSFTTDQGESSALLGVDQIRALHYSPNAAINAQYLSAAKNVDVDRIGSALDAARVYQRGTNADPRWTRLGDTVLLAPRPTESSNTALWIVFYPYPKDQTAVDLGDATDSAEWLPQELDGAINFKAAAIVAMAYGRADLYQILLTEAQGALQLITSRTAVEAVDLSPARVQTAVEAQTR